VRQLVDTIFTALDENPNLIGDVLNSITSGIANLLTAVTTAAGTPASDTAHAA